MGTPLESTVIKHYKASYNNDLFGLNFHVKIQLVILFLRRNIETNISRWNVKQIKVRPIEWVKASINQNSGGYAVTPDNRMPKSRSQHKQEYTSRPTLDLYFGSAANIMRFFDFPEAS